MDQISFQGNVKKNSSFTHNKKSVRVNASCV